MRIATSFLGCGSMELARAWVCVVKTWTFTYFWYRSWTFSMPIQERLLHTIANAMHIQPLAAFLLLAIGTSVKAFRQHRNLMPRRASPIPVCVMPGCQAAAGHCNHRNGQAAELGSEAPGVSRHKQEIKWLLKLRPLLCLLRSLGAHCETP